MPTEPLTLSMTSEQMMALGGILLLMLYTTLRLLWWSCRSREKKLPFALEVVAVPFDLIGYHERLYPLSPRLEVFLKGFLDCPLYAVHHEAARAVAAREAVLHPHCVLYVLRVQLP